MQSNTANISTAGNYGLVVGQNPGSISYTMNHTTSEEQVLQERIQACRDAIYNVNPAVDRESIKSAKGERVDGTCEWIKENGNYRAWLEPTRSPHSLWVRGGPGKGKTMLAMFLTEDLEAVCQNDNRLLVYFFCDHREENRSSAVGILRGIIWQMLIAVPGFHVHALHCTSDRKEARETSRSRDAL